MAIDGHDIDYGQPTGSDPSGSDPQNMHHPMAIAPISGTAYYRPHSIYINEDAGAPNAADYPAIYFMFSGSQDDATDIDNYIPFPSKSGSLSIQPIAWSGSVADPGSGSVIFYYDGRML